MITKIISGGQTGVDQGALEVALRLGLQTGGYAPKGWRTEAGPNPDLGRRYNLVETTRHDYRYRTTMNVQSSGGTLIFGNQGSPGCLLTYRLCQAARKPVKKVSWVSGDEAPGMVEESLFKGWLIEHRIRVLNVAGNREEKQPGIGKMIQAFLERCLT